MLLGGRRDSIGRASILEEICFSGFSNENPLKSEFRGTYAGVQTFIGKTTSTKGMEESFTTYWTFAPGERNEVIYSYLGTGLGEAGTFEIIREDSDFIYAKCTVKAPSSNMNLPENYGSHVLSLTLNRKDKSILVSDEKGTSPSYYIRPN